MAIASLAILACSCGAEPETGRGMLEQNVDYTELPYAAAVVSFDPGGGAGFGQDKMPDVVLGPPHGKGTQTGSIDVLSLGVGGQIVLDVSHRPITDGPGPDFLVFENAFWANNDPSMPFVELGEVSVSADGRDWFTYECKTESTDNAWPGCAGWHAVLPFEADPLVPLDPDLTGGDAFDLADAHLASASFVRIRDLSLGGEPPTAGFDLDAVGIIDHR